MKKTVLLLIALIVAMTVCLCGCKNELEKDGYVYNEPNGWYEKDGEDKDGTTVEGTFINLTKSQSDLSKQYVITPSVNRIAFIGNSSVTYTNFNIVIEGRTSDVYIELQNFKFEAPEGTDGINADDVFPSYSVFIISSGTSSVKGGKGQTGKTGTSYKYNASSGAPKDGGKGAKGEIGCSAISGNTIYITTNSSSSLTLIGGEGGDGGLGGDGEGSKGGGMGTVGKGAGDGATGGTGGDGGYAVNVGYLLKIESNGRTSFIGGTGGVGGNGGHGGNGGDPAFASPDDGGNGGHGGVGGSGGLGIYLQDSANIMTTNLMTVNVSGGNGGAGGNGGTGGDGHKWALDYASKGANAGDAGNGGKGGDGGLPTNYTDTGIFVCEYGQGGKGGSAGSPGAAPKGAGKAGTDGKHGNIPIES